MFRVRAHVLDQVMKPDIRHRTNGNEVGKPDILLRCSNPGYWHTVPTLEMKAIFPGKALLRQAWHSSRCWGFMIPKTVGPRIRI